jgi:hypothetical protein
VTCGVSAGPKPRALVVIALAVSGEAQELCHEEWLKDDLAEAKSDGAPLWDGKAKLRARIALPDERALFAEAKNNNGQPSDGLMLVYLVELDVGEIDEQPIDPGAFPPARS